MLTTFCILLILLVTSIVGYQLRHAEKFVRLMLHEVKTECPDTPPEQQARDKQLLLFITLSASIFTLGGCCYALRSFIPDTGSLALESWQLIPTILAGLFLGRLGYDYKLRRKLKSMTPEQRAEEFGDGSAILALHRPIREMPSIAPQQCSESSSYAFFYILLSLFLLAGLVLLYLSFV